MRLTFQLRFYTHPGQSLWLTGNHEIFGNGDLSRAIPLQYLNSQFWHATLVFPPAAPPDAEITYNYVLRNPDGTVIYDWGADKTINPASLTNDEVLIMDSWNPAGLYENAFYTEPFKNILLPSLSLTPRFSDSVRDERSETNKNPLSLAPRFSGVSSAAPEASKPFQRFPPPPSTTHTFKVKSPLLTPNQTLCLLGNSPALHNWNITDPILLILEPRRDYFTVNLDLTTESFPIAYKYGVYNLETKTFVRYEDGPNRTLQDTPTPALNASSANLPPDHSPSPPLEERAGERRSFTPNLTNPSSTPLYTPLRHTIINDGFAILPSTTWKGAGVAIPVFSLRSEHSFGVGEFTDLKLLVDWCRQTGLKLIQILPINDTIATHTWTDSYPYAAISAFALHPQYLNLSCVATGPNLQLLDQLEPERKRLNALDAIDYEAVINTKLAFLKQIFPSQKEKTFQSKDFQIFFGQNKHWLVPYARFSHFRDQYGTSDFTQWPSLPPLGVPPSGGKTEPSTLPSEAAAPSPSPPLEERAGERRLFDSAAEIDFHYFLQYHLHLQLKEAAEYSHSHGIILKGDIAIGVYRYGADAWQNPELYHMEMQAGAPPDPFADKGQNWGFPTYNWPRMKETGFAWWKQRFGQMSYYFDAFRIDHILGFFRIWSIPLHAVEGILGYFVPALPVQVSEFPERGIPFDHDRFVKPWITDEVLAQVFGRDAGYIKSYFLESNSFGHYNLKPHFATQRQVENHFNAWEQNEHNHRLKLGLFDLISNVILLEAGNSNGQEFHFRFAIENTSSFKALAPLTQSRLKALYIDYFFRRQEDFWMKEAMQKLPALKRVTNMLVCGEDLGLVPACVPDLMKQLGLLSLEIQRMPKDMSRDFSRPQEAPYLSVVTPSTHDMSTIRGWWEEDRAVTLKFYHQELGQPGEAPPTCEPWINKAIIQQHLSSPAMWSIFQLQDLLGIDQTLRRPNPADERINVPANPKNYWRYRLHLPLERLLNETTFNDEIKRLVHHSGR
jgi:4-alpha-glucanotransferase